MPTPIRSTVESLRATQAEEYLNASQSFLRKLEKAKLSAESDSTWEGKPARLLSLKLNPSLVEKDKKYIKEFEQTAQIWLDPSTGLPLAATTHVHLKGRAFIVISFEDESNESYRFQTVGDRLIITELRKDGKGSGGGESNTRKSLIKIDIAKS